MSLQHQKLHQLCILQMWSGKGSHLCYYSLHGDAWVDVGSWRTVRVEGLDVDNWWWLGQLGGGKGNFITHGDISVNIFRTGVHSRKDLVNSS